MAKVSPNVHVLKTDPEVFDAVWRGDKTYEIRYNDRGYKVGDTLLLMETRSTGLEMKLGAPLEYTGRNTETKVTHILAGPLYGLTEEWVILSIDWGISFLTAERDDLRQQVEELTQQRDFMRNLSQETGAKNDTLENQCIVYRNALEICKNACQDNLRKYAYKNEPFLLQAYNAAHDALTSTSAPNPIQEVV